MAEDLPVPTGTESADAARAAESRFLLTDRERAAKYIRMGWEAQDTDERRRQAQLKVNWKRYKGEPWAQIVPGGSRDRLWSPPSAARRTPPTVNRIRRTVQRYVAVVTADDPIVEAHPASHTDRDIEASEAATEMIMGEWLRLNLTLRIQESEHLAAIVKSAFIGFEFDQYKGPERPRMRIFRNPETNEEHLLYVDDAGDPVEEAAEAAMERQGETTVEVFSSFNVRWKGSQHAHHAEELWIGKLITLERLFQMYPETRRKKISRLRAGLPPRAELWLEDVRHGTLDPDGKSPGSTARASLPAESTFESLRPGKDSRDYELLNSKVFLLTYMRPPSKAYERGVHVVMAGKEVVYQEELRYPVLPIAHFKFLYEPGDRQGIGLVDMLKNPQELINFVDTKYLEALDQQKVRWFLEHGTNISARDLIQGTGTVHYIPSGVTPPTQEHPPPIPQDYRDYSARMDDKYNDEAGLHEAALGRRVPGATSGRQVRELRQGDETLLGLSKLQLIEGCEQVGRVLLEMGKVEWDRPRKVHYFGAGRVYMERSYSGADFGDTSQVHLKPTSLLMQSAAQKVEYLFGLAEMQAISPKQLQRLAPFGDVAGIEFSEDEHYKAARRDTYRWLKGPAPELEQVHEEYEERANVLVEQMQALSEAMTGGGTPAEQEFAMLQQEKMALDQEFEALLAQYAPQAMHYQLVDPAVAEIHKEEKMRALAREKISRLPKWWVNAFQRHAVQYVQAAMALPQEPGQAARTPAGSSPETLPPAEKVELSDSPSS